VDEEVNRDKTINYTVRYTTGLNDSFIMLSTSLVLTTNRRPLQRPYTDPIALKLSD